MKEKRAARRGAREAQEAARPADPTPTAQPGLDPATRRALLTIVAFALCGLAIVVIVLVGSSRQDQERRDCSARGGVIADVHGGGGWICVPGAR